MMPKGNNNSDRPERDPTSDRPGKVQASERKNRKETLRLTKRTETEYVMLIQIEGVLLIIIVKSLSAEPVWEA